MFKQRVKSSDRGIRRTEAVFERPTTTQGKRISGYKISGRHSKQRYGKKWGAFSCACCLHATCAGACMACCPHGMPPVAGECTECTTCVDANIMSIID